MNKKPPRLADFDLRQMSDAWLCSLEHEKLQWLSKRLLSELRDARDRLNRNPSNSSRPPSSMAPWELVEKDDVASQPLSAPADDTSSPVAPADDGEQAVVPAPEGSKAAPGGSSSSPDKNSGAKKAGKQPNAQGFGRTQKLAISHTVPHHPAVCTGCGQALPHIRSQAYTGWDEIDLAARTPGQTGLLLSVTRHLLYAETCSCGHVTRAAHYVAPDDPFWDKVDLGQWRLVGPRLAGVIVFLALRMRLSRARIRECLIELFDLRLSTGVLDETIREAGRAVAPLEDDMVRDIEAAALLHVDESPWKERRLLLWLWVFVATYTTLFQIGARTMEILSNVLTNQFQGDLMSDGYQAYRHLGRRLRCWAHLERKLRGLTESTDARIADTGNAMLGVLGRLMAAIYLARSTPPEAKGVLASQYAHDIALLRTLCEQHREDTHDKLRQIAVEFLLDWEVILRQVAEPHLPLTNNAAEIALRHWVIARRLSYGTRSEAGTRAFALLASVIETCRKRGASSWVFIASVIAAARNGMELPSLPSIPQGV